MWYNSHIGIRFHFDARKDRKLRADARRGIGFADTEEIFLHDYFIRRRDEVPEQFSAIGWVKGRLYSLVYEIREDARGEYYHLVTLWRATKEERQLYEENS